MCAHLHDADLWADKGRCAGSSHDTVCSGCRNTHSENDTAEHREEQSDDCLSTGNVNDDCDQSGSKTRRCDTSGNDTGHRACYGNGDCSLSTRLESIDDLRQVDAVILVDQTDKNRYADRNSCRELHCVHIGRNHSHENDQRKKKINLRQKILRLRKLFLRNSAKTKLLGFEMNRNIDSCKVQDSRKNGLQSYMCIRDAHILSHKECCRAHDRRHDLSACGGCRLDGTGEGTLITGLLHHRDCYGTGRNRISYGRSGDHAAQCGGNDRNLSRSAGRCTGYAVRQIDEEIRDTCPFEEGTEYDEYNNIFGAYIDRCVHETCRRVEEVIDDFAEANICKCIHQEQTDHNQDRHADAAAAEFHVCQNSADSHCDHQRVFGYTGCELDDIGCM